MKTKITEILDFASFYGAVKSKKMSIATAYKLNKLANAVETEVEFYRNKLQEIIQTYSEKDENGEYVVIDGGEGVKIVEGKEEECGKAMYELQNFEIELPDIVFGIDEFANVEITLEEFAHIAPFMRD